ncbi:MarR family transcriptional regulator [Nakamurella leprariae]|uniref:Winged helix-turn-helix transcriptional regulator n=1 Tax=Nakamurella leprariae TaxID=2803911 RepID=A0A938YBV6_9ACTN|nr:MarR family winged helix-turn-helix transcriptional regulator [Nakamurella leprariae]MBM9467762.1 winged helix-turn-helix transcriptional regulator [Nakamurella leprariae]
MSSSDPSAGTTPYIGLLFRRAQQAHVAGWASIVSGDTTSVQFGVLNAVAEREQASQRELCTDLDLDRSTIADIVARLERRGLLRRTRDTADRRRNVVELTGSGLDELAALRPRVDRLSAALVERLSRVETRTLTDLLTKALSDTGPADPPGRQ